MDPSSSSQPQSQSRNVIYCQICGSSEHESDEDGCYYCIGCGAVIPDLRVTRVAAEDIRSAALALVRLSDPLFALSDSLAVRETAPCARSLDDAFALFGASAAAPLPAPLDPPAGVVTTTLLPHQRQALGWLLARETSDDLPPFWSPLDDGSYLNVLTNYRIPKRPGPLRGGIFADDMGLGKTLTLLSLIALTLPDAPGRKPWRSPPHPRATLVVCPPSVFSSWVTQVEQHTRPGSLKVYIYHGERTGEAAELARHDIVLTTYGTLSAERSRPESPVREVEWLRVVLDEAHVINNPGAAQTKACVELRAGRRWVVTGMPIQNSSFDLFSLMAFLGFKPFSIKSYWRALVQRPLEQGKETGMARLKAILGAISLRRTKDVLNKAESLLGLPPKTVETCFVNLSLEERKQYENMEADAQNTIREFLNAHTLLLNYPIVLHLVLRLRQICDDVSLCPPDIRSFRASDTLEDVTQNPELLKKLVEMIQEGDDFDCPICLSPPSRIVITKCAHIFCQACILRTLEQLNARCPMCRHSLSKTDLFLAPPQISEDNKRNMPSDKPPSSKVSTLLKLLLEAKEQNPSTKSVVFSQFRKMLILMEKHLRAAGFLVARMDSSMSVKKRTDIIREFSTNSSSAPAVLLASLRAAGAGINLTAASRVYLVDPWWNPAVEEQAMDRVHRIGQQEEVKVVRLIVRNSIEERVLQLQELKKRLASGAFGEEQHKTRIEDIRMVMLL